MTWIRQYLILLVCGVSVLAYDLSSFPKCTDPLDENQGYSSTYRDGLYFWSHCGFPNPKQAASRCGKLSGNSVVYDLCDPDQVLDPLVEAQLDISLWGVEKTTPYQCTPWHGAKLNYTVLLVVVRYLRVPDMSSNETCRNGCDEIIPELDEKIRAPTPAEKLIAIRSFSQGLITNFEGYFCDNFAVVAYWENETMLSTALAPGIESLISASEIEGVEEEALMLLKEGSVQEAFQLIINRYRQLLIGFTPAYILLIVNILILLVMAVFLVLQFVLGTKSDYYDEEKWKVVIKMTLKILFGVWFIELLLMSLVRLQYKIKPWVVIFPILGFLAAIAACITIVILDARNQVETGTIAESVK